MEIQRLPGGDFAERLELDAVTGCGEDAEARKGRSTDRRARIYLQIPNQTEEDALYYQSLVQQLSSAADHTPQQ